MQVGILGPLEVRREGVRVPAGGRSERALLIRLALSANKVVSRDRLIDDLWDGAPPEGAAATLRVYLSRLRKALGPGIIVTREPGYLLSISGDELDAAQFERLTTEGRRLFAMGTAGKAGAIWREALGLWRGPALVDVADRSFAVGEAARLEELRLNTLECRIEADLACGRHGELAGELEALTIAHPLRERLWALHMLCLYRCGRQAEALRAYQQVRHLLAEGLGIDPGPELQQLEDAILRHAEALALSPVQAPEADADQTPAAPDDSAPSRVRVLVVDDHPLWRETMSSILARSGMVVAGEAGNGLDAVRLAREANPDVVLMDISVPGIDGIEATRRVTSELTETRVLVLSSSDDRAQVLEVVRAGASGYLVKTAGAAEISSAIDRIHAGELVFPPKLAAVVLEELRRLPDPTKLRAEPA
jgi:DNA-binding SARP family transcriptional activator